MSEKVRKLKGHGLRQCNRRKLEVAKTDDELAPLWADLKASIEKVCTGRGGYLRTHGVKDITVYRAYRSDGTQWTPQ